MLPVETPSQRAERLAREKRLVEGEAAAEAERAKTLAALDRPEDDRADRIARNLGIPKVDANAIAGSSFAMAPTPAPQETLDIFDFPTRQSDVDKAPWARGRSIYADIVDEYVALNPERFRKTPEDQVSILDDARRNLSIEQAIKANPDEEARIRDIAGKLQMPPAMVRAIGLAEAANRLTRQQAKQVGMDAPATLRLLTDQDRAKIAIDDFNALSGVERALRELFVSNEITANRKTIGNLSRKMADGVALRPSEMFEYERLKARNDILQRQRQMTDNGVTWFTNTIAEGATDFALGLPEMATYGAAGAVVGLLGGPGGAAQGFRIGAGVGQFAYNFDQIIGHSFEEYKNFRDDLGRLIDQDAARGAAYVNAVLSVGLEVAGERALMKTVPGLDKLVGGKDVVKSLLRTQAGRNVMLRIGKKVATGAIIEGVTEGLQQLTQIYTGEVLKIVAPGEFAPIAPEEVVSQTLQAAAAGAVGTLGITVPGATAQVLIENRELRKADKELTTSEGTVNRIEAAIAAAADTKLVNRDRGELERFINDAAADSPVSTIYLSAEDLATVATKAGLEPIQLAQQLGVSDQIQTAATTGSLLEMPIGKFIATVANTDLATPLTQVIKTNPFLLNRVEQEAYASTGRADIIAEADRLVQEAVTDETFAAEAQSIQDEVLQQFRAIEGGEVFTPEVSRAYSTITTQGYVSLARRMGISPREAYQKYQGGPLRIQREAGAAEGMGQPVIEQAQSQGYTGQDIGEATEWVRARAKGLDMSQPARMERARAMGFDTDTVLYHGTTADIREFMPGKDGALGAGVYLTQDPSFAGRYAIREGGNVVPVYVRGKFISDAEWNQLIDEEAGKAVAAGLDSNVDEQVLSLLKDQGYAGIEFKGKPQQLVIFNPANIRSVNAAFDPDFAESANVLAQDELPKVSVTADPAAFGLTPEQAKKVNPIYNPKTLPVERLPSNQEAALWLEGNYIGDPVTDLTAELSDEQIKEIATIMAAEAQLALGNTGNAFTWYSSALAKALDIISIKYPMLADDAAAAEAGLGTSRNARFVFTYIMAVTSQNLDVAANSVATDKAFGDMLKRVANGNFTMPRSWGTGDKQKAMGENFAKFGPLIDKMPGDDFPSKLAALDDLFRVKMTVKEWVAYMKQQGVPYNKPGQTAMDAVVYGSSLLGPKIGNGFWQNLNGNYDPMTIDLWMRRTWGRLTGKSIGNPAALPEQRARLAGAIKRSRSREQGKPDHIAAMAAKIAATEKQLDGLNQADFASKKEFAAEEKRLKAEIKDNQEALADLANLKAPETWSAEYNTSNDALLAYAKRLLKAWNVEYERLKKASKSGTVPAEAQPTWARAAKTIITNLAKPLDQVANGTQRKQIERAGKEALRILQERGITLTTADLQAILWYPEKELWGSLTAELETDEDGDPVVPPSSLNESYDTAFSRILKEQGYEIQGIAGDGGGGLGAGAVARQDGGPQQPASSGRVGAPGGAIAERGPDTLGQEQISGRRPQQLGARDGRRAYSSGGLAPLEGAPAKTAGPDPSLITVAEDYAAANGIPLRRPARFAELDVDRAQRIAAAFDAMQHAPNDPAVREAYENLKRQTRAQYDALIAAGYVFTFYDGDTDPYAGNPMNAMRDLRNNKRMAVYGTYSGYGTEGVTEGDRADNPMLEDAGLKWPDQNGAMQPVTANDLFRAVHDAFGHGLEAAGFRARGEENAWQAHMRLYTGSAVGAATTELRGQNSWLNYGPYGETNRTAKVEDTVFAENKIGLMPEWTWTEGRVEDMPEEPQSYGQSKRNPLFQTRRAEYRPDLNTIRLLPKADWSSYLHEMGHHFLEVYNNAALQIEQIPEADRTPDEQKIVDDMRILLTDMARQAGVTVDGDVLQWWANTPLEGRTPVHEKYAEATEKYFMEGKAPVPELQALFDRFKEWLIKVYQNLTALNVELTPEVRGVMDRMYAAHETVKTAEYNRRLVALFREKPETMTDQEWRAYQELGAQATSEAQDDLTARSLRDMQWASGAKARVLRDMQRDNADKRKLVRAEVAAEVMARPVNVARSFFRRGIAPNGEPVTGPHKLNIDLLKARYPDVSGVDWKRLGYGQYGMLAKDGIDPDMAAEMLGYPSGEGMIRDLLAAGPAEPEIDAETDRRMLERFGDLTDEAKMSKAADEVIHSALRAKVLQAEYAALAKAARQTKPLVIAAREIAKEIVGRQLASKLNLNKYLAAERAAGRKAEAALRSGDFAAAASAKRDQLLNFEVVREAQRVLKERDKALDLFSRINKAKRETVSKTRNYDLVQTVRAMLAAYGFGSVKNKPQDYMDLIAEYNSTLYEQVRPIIDAATKTAKTLDQLTVSEFLGLRDTVKELWDLSREEMKIEVEGRKQDLAEVLEEFDAQFVNLKVEAPTFPKETPKKWEQELRKFLSIPSITRRVESLARLLDLGKTGPFTKYIWRQVSDAAEAYRADNVKYLKKLSDIFKKYESNFTNVRGKIEANGPGEIGFVFNGGKAELLHAIAHTGNSSNNRKLKIGYGWGSLDQDGNLIDNAWTNTINRLARDGILTKSDFDMVQELWDLNEEIKPLAQQTHRKVFGRYFEEITAEPVETPFGTYRGGYMPAITEQAYVPKAQKREAQEIIDVSQSQMFPAPANGFTKSRDERYAKPLALNLDLIPQHINKVLKFAHMAGPSKDVQKILNNDSFARSLEAVYPGADANVITPWLNRAIRQIIETPVSIPAVGHLDKFAGYIRTNSGIGIMFGNLVNSIQNLTGITNAVLVIKPVYLARAKANYMRNPFQMRNFINEASPMMRNRADTQIAAMNNSMQRIMRGRNAFNTVREFSQEHGYFMQFAFQNPVDTIVWMAAYDQAISAGETPYEATKQAEAIVRRTQGSSAAEDISLAETGPHFVRLFTHMYGYFNMLGNLYSTEVRVAFRASGIKKGLEKAFFVYIAGFTSMAVLGALIADGLRGQLPEEDEEDGWLGPWFEWFFNTNVKTATAFVPLFGQGLQGFFNAFNDKPYDDRVLQSPGVGAAETIVRAPFSVSEAITGQGDVSKAIKDTLSAMTTLTGVPLSALNRPFGYLADVAEGDVEPTSTADFIRGMVTGTASEASKQ